MHAVHEPPDYLCRFCALITTEQNSVLTTDDIAARNAAAVAFISPRWWPNNPGHVLVVPTAHHENLYDLPAPSGHAVHDLVRDVALAIRQTCGCDGISTRQHNEPGGGQDAWHYHVHVLPRYAGDNLYRSRPLPGFADAGARKPFAEKLRGCFALP